MEQRERLIELLKQMDFDYGEECVCAAEDGYRCAPDFAEFFADHILADGWMRPPCKVGQTVYKLYPKEQHWDAVDRKWIITAWTFYECNIVSVHYSENKQGKKTLKYRCSRIDVPSVCKDHSVDEFGKTVFTSREEAEAELERRKQ